VGARAGDKLGSAAEVTGEFSCVAVLGTLLFSCSADLKYGFFLICCLGKKIEGRGQVYKNVITKLR